MLSCSEVVCTFHGDIDDNADRDPRARTTELKVTVTHAGAGPYLVIETDRWAFDEPEELTAILEKVKKRCFKLFDGGPLWGGVRLNGHVEMVFNEAESVALAKAILKMVEMPA